MTKVTDDIDLIDKIMIERLQDGCDDFCDDIRASMRDLVKDESEIKWVCLISGVEDLAAGLRVLSSYGVIDWFPEIPEEMQIQKPPPQWNLRKSPKKRKKKK